jgi:glycoprotein endo-alpha-1,2-mannosidase
MISPTVPEIGPAISSQVCNFLAIGIYLPHNIPHIQDNINLLGGKMPHRFCIFAITALLVVSFCHRLFAAADKDYCVGAYYYPWYTDANFVNGDLSRNQTLIFHLKPRMSPQLGWYSQTRPEIISQHYKWAKYAGIDFFVTSYWGRGSITDNTTRDHMFGNPNRGNIKLAVFFEPTIRAADVTGEINYLCDNYFNRDGYFRIDNKPVIFVYLTRTMTDPILAAYTGNIRKAARDKGVGEVYIVGDEMFGFAKERFKPGRVKLLDAITNYDVYGHLGHLGAGGRYVSAANLDAWKVENALWQAKTHKVERDFIPAVTPGFNDKAVRPGHEPKSRKLNNDSGEFGSLFAGLLEGARQNADHDMIMITSWNEWYEDTQIEPTAIAPPTNIDDSPTARDYTRRLYYNGYGTLYLDIVRDKTTQSAVDNSARQPDTSAANARE